MENFNDTINLILLAAAVVSVVIGLIKEGWPRGLIEGISIMIALVIIITVTSANNWVSERQLADLIAHQELQEIPVYRGSSTQTITIDASELAVGDVVILKEGNQVPADCIIIEGQNLYCIESDLTGEPDEIEKVPITESNFRDGSLGTMLAKSLIVKGVCTALVVGVGSNSVAGIISSKTMCENEPTLLMKKLDNMAG